MPNRHDSTAGRRRRNQIGAQFTAFRLDMLQSPAWRVLSKAALRVIFRISIEVRKHGGRQVNGVAVTYEDFVAYGIDRHSIAPAIREVVALGFIDIVRHGRAGNAEHRQPTLYRATFDMAVDCEPSHRWQRIRTIEEAQQKHDEARQPRRRGNRNPVGVITLSPVGVSTTESRRSPVGVSPTMARVITPTTSDISVGDGRAGLSLPRSSTPRDRPRIRDGAGLSPTHRDRGGDRDGDRDRGGERPRPHVRPRIRDGV